MGHDTGGTHRAVAPAEPGLAVSLGSEGSDYFLKDHLNSALHFHVRTSACGPRQPRSCALRLAPVPTFAFHGCRAKSPAASGLKAAALAVPSNKQDATTEAASLGLGPGALGCPMPWSAEQAGEGL